MESNDKLKDIDIKSRTCYCFDDIIKIEDFDLDDSLIDEKTYENILVYNISYKSLIDSQPLRIRFDKTDGFIRVYSGTRYLVLLGTEKYDSIYDWIRYLISVKSGITYIFSHNYTTIKVDSYDYLSLEKTITPRNIIILVKSVWNKDKNNYYYNIFLEKVFYELPKKISFCINNENNNNNNNNILQQLETKMN